jgi:hypothetical protein
MFGRSAPGDGHRRGLAADGDLELALAEQLANTKPRAAFVALAPDEGAPLVVLRDLMWRAGREGVPPRCRT